MPGLILTTGIIDCAWIYNHYSIIRNGVAEVEKTDPSNGVGKPKENKNEQAKNKLFRIGKIHAVKFWEEVIEMELNRGRLIFTTIQTKNHQMRRLEGS